MRKSKRWLTTLCAVLLAIGLGCTQVCQLVCATAACANQAQAAPAEPQPEHGHCHHPSQPTTKRPADSLPSTPGPRHDCQQHPVLQLLPPDKQFAKAGPPPDWQTTGHAPLIVVAFASVPFATHPLPRSLFRPPPRSWLSTVQRI